MKSVTYISISLFSAVTAAATPSTNTTQVACARDSNKVCCMASIVGNGQTNATNVCCNGSVVGSGNTDNSTTLLDVYDELTCCQGDTANAVLMAATCTAGVSTPMRSIAASQGVGGTTSTSSGLGYKATAAPMMGSAVMMGGAYAVAAWVL